MIFQFRFFHLVYPIACSALLALSGCVSVPEKPIQPPLSENTRHLLALSYWKLEGRVAAKVENEGWNANLVWEHVGDQERVRLSGPFNQGAVSILVERDLIVVNDGKGASETSKDPDAWLKERLGFTVPLRRLRFWVMGIPDPDQGAQFISNPESPEFKGFVQDGWQLQTQRLEVIDGKALPKKLTLHNGNISLKFVADDWIFN